MFSEKTKGIDILKLERENQKFFYIGFALGIVCIVLLDPFIEFRDYTDLAQFHAVKIEAGKTIKVELITIPRETEKLTTPIIEQERKEEEQLIIDKRDFVELPVADIADTIDKEISEEKIVSMLQQTGPPKKFPDLSAGRDFPAYEIPAQDTIKPPDGWLLFPKQQPEPEKIETIPVEEIKDERRRFRQDVFGIPLGGIGVLPVHLGRHAAKSLVWKIQDIFKERRIEEARNSNFTLITEKDLRFMILLWRDGLLNPHKLSKNDILFIVDVKQNTYEVMTHKMYLLEMEKRGLVSSLVVDGDLVFRVNFSRSEVLDVLFFAYKLDVPDEKDSINEYIQLITSCYDSSKDKVIIPGYVHTGN